MEDEIKETIGVAIITYKRFWSFERVFKSLHTDKVHFNKILIVNATPTEENEEYEKFFDDLYTTLHTNASWIEVINSPGQCVGVNKNIAFRKLMDHKHIFIIENDIEIIDPTVFERYIKTAKDSGLPHLMFGYHGPNNLLNGQPNPILKVKYNDDTTVWFNGGCVGAFNYYERDCLQLVGLMDPRYHNANEHISHTYRYVQFGFLPAYKRYPDIENSNLYLRETASPSESTTIPIEDENIRRNCVIFREAHMPPNEPKVGFADYPMTNEMVIERLKTIQQRKLV